MGYDANDDNDTTDVANTSSSLRNASDVSSLLSKWHKNTSDEEDVPNSTSEFYQNYFSSSAYRKRVLTFHPKHYFAKPNALSPLICARFGWICTSRDQLTCCFPECKGSFSITFHPRLSSKGVEELVKQYRCMLVNKHGSNCPFRSDAQNFLLEESKEEEGEEGIPSYLYPTCNDLLIFHDCLRNKGNYARSLIRKRAKELDDLLVASSGNNDEASKPRYKIQLPQSLDSSYDLSTFNCLTEGSEKESKTIDESCALLAVFGWSYMNNSMKNQCLKVECSVCLVRDIAVPMDTVTVSRKRKSRNDENVPSPMNVAKSHRHFCPYVCRLGEEKEFGWKVVLSKSVEKLPLLENDGDVIKILKNC